MLFEAPVVEARRELAVAVASDRRLREAELLSFAVRQGLEVWFESTMSCNGGILSSAVSLLRLVLLLVQDPISAVPLLLGFAPPFPDPMSVVPGRLVVEDMVKCRRNESVAEDLLTGRCRSGDSSRLFRSSRFRSSHLPGVAKVHRECSASSCRYRSYRDLSSVAKVRRERSASSCQDHSYFMLKTHGS